VTQMKPTADGRRAADRRAAADGPVRRPEDDAGEENPRVQDAAPDPGQIGVGRGGRRMPRLPHERDESTDGQRQHRDSPDKSMQQASIDVARGLEDTDRGPVIERIEQEHLVAPRRVRHRPPRKARRGPARGGARRGA